MRPWLVPGVLALSLLANAGLVAFALRVAPAPSAEPEPALLACRVRLAALSTRLEAVRTELVLHLSPPERFEQSASEATPGLLPRVRPALERALGTAPHALECRAQVCRLTFEERPGTGWSAVLLTDPSVGPLLEGWEVTAGQEGRLHVYLALADPGAASGRERLGELLVGFRSSRLLPGCADRHGERGDLRVELSAGNDGDLGLWVQGGSLLHTAAGGCVQEALRTYLEQHIEKGPLSFARETVSFELE